MVKVLDSRMTGWRRRIPGQTDHRRRERHHRARLLLPHPVGRNIIPYEAIRSIHRYPMSGWSGKQRGWGATDPRVWFSLDIARMGKTVGYVLTLADECAAVLTPDDPDGFESALRAHNLDSSKENSHIAGHGWC